MNCASFVLGMIRAVHGYERQRPLLSSPDGVLMTAMGGKLTLLSGRKNILSGRSEPEPLLRRS